VSCEGGIHALGWGRIGKAPLKLPRLDQVGEARIGHGFRNLHSLLRVLLAAGLDWNEVTSVS